MDIRRWISGDGDDGAEMWRDNEGDYVLFADHEAAVRVLREALALILDNADYTRGNCRVNELVGAVLPKEILAKARAALK